MDTVLIYIAGVFLILNGDIIPSHGYSVISDIGGTGDTALICHTNRFGNLTSTPTSTQHHSGGDWFAPDGSRVGNLGSDDVPGFVRERHPMMVQLLRNPTTDPPSEGMYYCVVEDDTFTEQTVYVGLYNSGGGGIGILFSYSYPTFSYISFFNKGDVIMSGGMTFTMVDPGLNTSLQFTLTCISTDGPATTVTWTRDSGTASGDEMTAFNGNTTAPQYTHTLTVTGRLEGLYTCTVANNRPSKVSAQFTVQGMHDSINFAG